MLPATFSSRSFFHAARKGVSTLEYAVLVGVLSTIAVSTVEIYGQQAVRVFLQNTQALEPRNVAEAEPQAPTEGAGDADAIDDPLPATDYGSDTDYLVGNFQFSDSWINRWDGRDRIVSDYVDIPGLEGNPMTFAVSSPDGGRPVAVSHTADGQPAASGTLVYGTQLEVDPPDLGQTRIVRLSIGGRIVTWVLEREAGPTVQPFTFPDTVVAWDDTRSRIESSYINIEGLEGDPLPFSVGSDDGQGFPMAINHVQEGAKAPSGTLVWGTQLEVDLPEPGETRTVTLVVDGVEGQWRVSRAPRPARPDFQLTSNNHMNFAHIVYQPLGIPKDNYRFTLSGTGESMPWAQQVHSGSAIDGTTPDWGINIHNKKPKKGSVETITLVIDGQTITWKVYAPSEGP